MSLLRSFEVGLANLRVSTYTLDALYPWQSSLNFKVVALRLHKIIMLPSAHKRPLYCSKKIPCKVFYLQDFLFGLLIVCWTKAEPTPQLGIYLDAASDSSWIPVLGFLCYKLQKLLKPSKDLCQCAIIAWCLLFPQLQVETWSLHLLQPSLLFASHMRLFILLWSAVLYHNHPKILLWHEKILLRNSRSCKCTELKQVTEELMQMNI